MTDAFRVIPGNNGTQHVIIDDDGTIIATRPYKSRRDADELAARLNAAGYTSAADAIARHWWWELAGQPKIA